MCCFEFYFFVFTSCNTLIAQFRLIRFGSILFLIHVLHAQVFVLTWQEGYAFSIAEFESI
jgi:hypothetical protein